MLDLCCCGISVASLSRGYFLLLCAGFSLRWRSCGRAWTLGAGFSSCGTQAWLPHSMRDLPRPGMEPMSPALAGRFLTTGPPGKPENQLFNNIQQKNSPAKEYLLAWYTISFLSSPPLSPSKELFDQPSGSHLSVVLCALPFKALYTQQQEWVFKSTNPAYQKYKPRVSFLCSKLKRFQFAQRKSCNQFPKRPSTISFPLTLFPSLSALAGALFVVSAAWNAFPADFCNALFQLFQSFFHGYLFGDTPSWLCI